MGAFQASCFTGLNADSIPKGESRVVNFTPPEATNTGPLFLKNRGSGDGAWGVASKNGLGHMRVQRGPFPIARNLCLLCVCVCVATIILKWQLVYTLNYSGEFFLKDTLAAPE